MSSLPGRQYSFACANPVSRPDILCWGWQSRRHSGANSLILLSEHRDQRTAPKLKAVGVKRGWLDRPLLSSISTLQALELKRIGKKMSAEQQVLQLWCISASVASSLVELIVFAHGRCRRDGAP